MPRGRRRSRDDTGALSSLEQAANAIYSSDLPPEIAELDSRRKPARPVNIFDIYPDRTQPRRVLPSVVRQQWDGDPHSISSLFEIWLYEIRLAGVPDFDLEHYLEQTYLAADVEGNEDDAVEDMQAELPPVARSLRGIVELAVSIRDTGLTNPITLAKDERIYHLETGERRWLAYHLLNIYDTAGDWSKIRPIWSITSVSGGRPAKITPVQI